MTRPRHYAAQAIRDRRSGMEWDEALAPVTREHPEWLGLTQSHIRAFVATRRTKG